ncbi:MAG: hypothetical protein KBB37_05600 [Bacteroidia bacterium]|nr:hypothetical protein [Bacteroidia bacterium]MBP7260743.1 hypothetical protein [Bacteroidia bacterium]MBP9179902.1 hypothetical protein [Bacteroidia bacterium]MBP9724177.1 hypothetical protein [Bacteroidia bacterium]
MLINDTLNKSGDANMLCTANEDQGMSFYLLGDTLSFQKRYYSSESNYKQLYIDRYDLLILGQTDTSIIVKPISKLSKEFFSHRPNITFVRQEFNWDRSIVFEKIIYHSSDCLGGCPTIDLEIKGRNVYLKGQFYKEDSINYFNSEIDTIQSGEFISILSDSLYNELINILQTSSLRTLTFPEHHGYDAGVTTLIIYYNGKRKYLQSMFPPTISNRLVDFLHYINTRADLKRTFKKRKIER